MTENCPPLPLGRQGCCLAAAWRRRGMGDLVHFCTLEGVAPTGAGTAYLVASAKTADKVTSVACSPRIPWLSTYFPCSPYSRMLGVCLLVPLSRSYLLDAKRVVLGMTENCPPLPLGRQGCRQAAARLPPGGSLAEKGKGDLVHFCWGRF